MGLWDCFFANCFLRRKTKRDSGDHTALYGETGEDGVESSSLHPSLQGGWGLATSLPASPSLCPPTLLHAGFVQCWGLCCLVVGNVGNICIGWCWGRKGVCRVQPLAGGAVFPAAKRSRKRRATCKRSGS